MQACGVSGFGFGLKRIKCKLDNLSLAAHQDPESLSRRGQISLATPDVLDPGDTWEYKGKKGLLPVPVFMPIFLVAI